MEDRDYRSEVGKKIEEALANGDFDLIEDLIEVPPMETFMQWAEKGEEKRKKRVCRKRILVSCLAIVVVSASVLIGLKCFALPEVTADPEDDVTIEMNDMESIETYSSWDELPDEIKEQFIEVKDLPDGYVVEKIEVKTYNYRLKLKVNLKKDKLEMEIRQSINLEGGLPNTIITNESETINIEDIIAYVEKKEKMKTVTYKYFINNISIDIVAPIDAKVENINDIIKTVQ